MGARGSFRGVLGLNQGQLTAVGAWYRMAASTAVAGEWQTITDVLGGASLVQDDTDRRLAQGLSANGYPIGTYDGTDVMRMPLGANNFNVTKFGLALWQKHAGAGGEWFAIYNNDAGVRVLDCYVDPNGKVYISVYTDNVTGRVYETANGAITPGAWNYQRVEIDFTRANECDTTGTDTNARIRFFRGEVARALTATNLGVGAVPSTLRAPTGSAIWGALNDADLPSTPMASGTIHGPNTFLFTSTPTTTGALALMNFEAPT
jgi:hypothetical protein